MKILRTLLLYGPDSLGLSVIYIKAEGFSGKMLKLRLHATRPSFYREARGRGQTGVGFNQPDLKHMRVRGISFLDERFRFELKIF